MSSRRPGPPGAVIRTVPYGDRHQVAVVFPCGSCPEEFIHRFPQGTASYDVAAKKARTAGWDADPDRAGANQCPACKATRRKVASPPKSRAAAPLCEPAQTVPPPEEISIVVPKPLSPATAGVREPTSDERLRIRNFLDAHFDDKAGGYLDGLTDQTAGERLNLPWAMIAKIREVGYGPIRMDPATQALRMDLTAMSVALSEARAEMDAAAAERRRADEATSGRLAKLTADHRALVARFVAIEKQRGAA